MKNQTPLLIYFSFILLLSCSSNSSTYDIDSINDEGIILKQWHIVGPFLTEESEDNLKTNYLNANKTEKSITYDEFIRLELKAKIHNNAFRVPQGVILDFNNAFNLHEEKSLSGVAYAACILKSSKTQTLKLNFSSDDGAKIWLNHQLILENERGSAITPYQHYLDLPLKKGKNFLLIKVSNIEKQWAMFASVERESINSIKRYKKNFELQYGNTFLSKNIIENDTIKLTWGIPENKYKLKISGAEDLLLDIVPNQNINISHLPNGFYNAALYTPTDTFTNRFYKTKNASHDFNELIKNIQKSPAGKENININALLHRYNLLMRPENLPGEGFQKRNWDRRMLFILENLKNEYRLINKKAGEAKGTLLRSYRSEIDNGSQYYILHVPKKYDKKKPIPLVLEIAKLMKWFPSPLETNRFANIDLTEHFSDMANKYNMIVVEPGSRTVDKPNYNSIDETDLWETINDIKKAYHIDTNRIFLRGACRASYDALRLAVRYPDKFAAISTVSPEIIHNEKTDNIWLHHHDPFNFLGNIKDIPFYNIHSVLDTHSLISSSDRLYEMSKEAGLKRFSYRKLFTEFKPYYSDEYLDDIFCFFSKAPGITQPASIKFSTDQLKYNRSFWISLNHIAINKTANIHASIEKNVLSISRANVLSYSIDLSALPYDKDKPLIIYDNGKRIFNSRCSSNEITIHLNVKSRIKRYKTPLIEGPFAHIFNKPFIVVPGTSGNSKDMAQIQEIVKKLNDNWQHRYYASFRIKPDTALTKKDCTDFSLLLIGSPESNQIINKMIGYIPISIEKERISIGQKSINGRSLGFYMIYPSLYNPQKYVAILGYNAPEAFNLGSERDDTNVFDDVSDYGWYDYKVWDNSLSAKTLSGYFNEIWEP